MQINQVWMHALRQHERHRLHEGVHAASAAGMAPQTDALLPETLKKQNPTFKYTITPATLMCVYI